MEVHTSICTPKVTRKSCNGNTGHYVDSLQVSSIFLSSCLPTNRRREPTYGPASVSSHNRPRCLGSQLTSYHRPTAKWILLRSEPRGLFDHFELRDHSERLQSLTMISIQTQYVSEAIATTRTAVGFSTPLFLKQSLTG